MTMQLYVSKMSKDGVDHYRIAALANEAADSGINALESGFEVHTRPVELDFHDELLASYLFGDGDIRSASLDSGSSAD